VGADLNWANMSSFGNSLRSALVRYVCSWRSKSAIRSGIVLGISACALELRRRLRDQWAVAIALFHHGRL
jgi:hypothetical protein